MQPLNPTEEAHLRALAINSPHGYFDIVALYNLLPKDYQPQIGAILDSLVRARQSIPAYIEMVKQINGAACRGNMDNKLFATTALTGLGR